MHSGKKIYGAVNLNVPLPYVTVMLGFGVLVAMMLMYAINVDFSDRYEVKGYLNAKSGTAPVFGFKPGVISTRFVEAGQHVSQGQDLFLVDTCLDPVSYAQEQRLLTKRLQRVTRSIKQKKQYLHTLQPLLAKHYLSLATYQSVLDQLRELEADHHAQNLALLHHQQSRYETIRSPITGTVSSLESQVGQSVRLTQPLATILPEHAELVAQLYVPVAKSGFLQQGAQIALHYDGYPFQQFGIATAAIQTISHSILTDKEEDKPIPIEGPYYQVVAQLDRQYILSAGQRYWLQQGMTFTAVISGAHKKVWRWIFDPFSTEVRG